MSDGLVFASAVLASAAIGATVFLIVRQFEREPEQERREREALEHLTEEEVEMLKAAAADALEVQQIAQDAKKKEEAAKVILQKFMRELRDKQPPTEP